MFKIITRFRRDEGGATATEYAMLIVFIALAIAVGAQTLGNDLNTLFTNIGTLSPASRFRLPRLPLLSLLAAWRSQAEYVSDRQFPIILAGAGDAVSDAELLRSVSRSDRLS